MGALSDESDGVGLAGEGRQFAAAVSVTESWLVALSSLPDSDMVVGRNLRNPDARENAQPLDGKSNEARNYQQVLTS